MSSENIDYLQHQGNSGGLCNQKYDSFYCIFWTNDSFVNKPSLVLEPHKIKCSIKILDVCMVLSWTEFCPREALPPLLMKPAVGLVMVWICSAHSTRWKLHGAGHLLGQFKKSVLDHISPGWIRRWPLWWQIETSRVRMKCVFLLLWQWVWTLHNNGKQTKQKKREKKKGHSNWSLCHLCLTFCQPASFTFVRICQKHSFHQQKLECVQTVMCLQCYFGPQVKNLRIYM